MFQRIGAAAFKKDLRNTQALCAALGNPETRFKTVHVAGTNGKGSVSAYLASVLQAAGYKTGLYTSPHLRDFTERIRVDGLQIPREAVVAFVEKHAQLIEEVQPSFFELTVAMAFDWFAQQAVDVAVIEVGMGGRLDSTNVIRPELCVITNISMDHAQFLGDSLALIAGEKAGIIKEGIPVVVGSTQPETEPVFRAKAGDLGAPITFADSLYEMDRVERNLQGQAFEVVRDRQLWFEELHVALPGLCQEENTATALEALFQLRERGFEIGDEAIRSGFSRVRENTGIRGRMEVLSYKPLVLADVAHNAAGIAEVLRFLAYVPRERLHMVWGAVDDKDPVKLLEMLPREASYYWVKPDVPRGMDAGKLGAAGYAIGLNGNVHGDVRKGLDAALAAAGENDLIFVGGSTFVVAEVI